MDTDNIRQPGNAVGEAPAIIVTLGRADRLASLANSLADCIQAVADRLDGVPSAPSTPPNTERAYGPSLVDTFLRAHDKTEEALERAKSQLTRIAAIV